MSNRRPAPLITQSFCQQPTPDDKIFELVPGCECEVEYNPEGNGWCGYYAIAFAFLFPSYQRLADMSPVGLRNLLAKKYVENKPVFEQSLVFSDELEEDLTMQPIGDDDGEEMDERWWCTFDMICLAALIFRESFFYKNGEEVEEDGSIIPPILVSIQNKPPKYLFYYAGNVHYRVYELKSFPSSFTPTPFPLQFDIDNLYNLLYPRE